MDILTRASILTPVRIRFDYDVVRTADDTVAATGHTVHAALDANGRPCRLPPRVREMLA
jgi:acyl-CoA thioesterase FadM